MSNNLSQSPVISNNNRNNNHSSNNSPTELCSFHQSTPESYYLNWRENGIKNNNSFDINNSIELEKNSDIYSIQDLNKYSYDNNPDYKTEHLFYNTRPVTSSLLLVEETAEKIENIIGSLKKYHESTKMLPHLCFTPNRDVNKDDIIVYKIDCTSQKSKDTIKKHNNDIDFVRNSTEDCNILIPPLEDSTINNPSYSRIEVIII